MDNYIIFPVIVLYKCQLNDALSYTTLVRHISHMPFMVYDNSPETFVFEKGQLPEAAIYVRDVQNGGVSMAYNTAVKYALEHEYSHCLLLDQDTSFPQDAYSHYQQMLSKNMLCAPTLITKCQQAFSPCSRKGFRTKAVSIPSGRYSLYDYMPVNSGMCIPTRYFLSVDGYNRQIRLDFADFDFLGRYRKVYSDFLLLPFIAKQDFSNDEKSVIKLEARYLLYLDSAQATRWQTVNESFIFHVEVLLHTLALCRRTKSVRFLKSYFNFLVKRCHGNS